MVLFFGLVFSVAPSLNFSGDALLLMVEIKIQTVFCIKTAVELPHKSHSDNFYHL